MGSNAACIDLLSKLSVNWLKRCFSSVIAQFFIHAMLFNTRINDLKIAATSSTSINLVVIFRKLLLCALFNHLFAQKWKHDKWNSEYDTMNILSITYFYRRYRKRLWYLWSNRQYTLNLSIAVIQCRLVIIVGEGKRHFSANENVLNLILKISFILLVLSRTVMLIKQKHFKP